MYCGTSDEGQLADIFKNARLLVFNKKSTFGRSADCAKEGMEKIQVITDSKVSTCCSTTDN
jgi:hypothetical protein